MKNKIIYIVFALSACATDPMYIYENNHVLDDMLQGKDMCVVIDNSKTIYEKGVKTLEISPFLGEEGYSPDSVEKTERKYKYNFVNDTCKNPVSISMHIKVSSLVFPGTCAQAMYAGSVYTGSTTYSSGFGSATAIGNRVYGSYSGVSNTQIHSTPMYNTYMYPCMKETYVIDISFYKDSKYIGKIRSKEWSYESDTNDTIGVFIEDFIRILNKEKNVIK